MEYIEIGQNLRHLNDMRARGVQFSVSVLGALAVVATSVYSTTAIEDKNPVLITLAAMWVVVCIVAIAFESRLAKIFGEITNRAIMIEENYAGSADNGKTQIARVKHLGFGATANNLLVGTLAILIVALVLAWMVSSWS